MKKQVDVVMLPTEKAQLVKGDILLRHIWKDTKNECRSIWQYNETITIDNVVQYTTLNGSFRDAISSFKPQHIYFLSDEEIKEGDWCILLDDYGNVFSKPQQYLAQEGQVLNNGLRKIIATTDESLTTLYYNREDKIASYYKLLPRPSNEFIKKYCELGGVDKALVEYDEKCCDGDKSTELCNSLGCKNSLEILKVAPDNTITIYPI